MRIRPRFALMFLALALPLALTAGGGLRAQGMPKAVIAVLDNAQIMQTSDAAKDIRRQVQDIRDRFRDSIQTEEHRLRQQEAELKRQRSILSPEVYEERRQKFKGQVIAAQRRGQDHQRQLDEAFKSAMSQVQAAVIDIVQQLTEEKGYTIVVDNSQVLVADRTLDITRDVITRLNQKLKTVTVTKPQQR